MHHVIGVPYNEWIGFTDQRMIFVRIFLILPVPGSMPIFTVKKEIWGMLPTGINGLARMFLQVR